MTEKPGGNPPAGKAADTDADTDASADSIPGRLGRDDRGNITWEWKDEGDLLADDDIGSTARLRALVDPKLAVTDDDDDPLNPVRHNPKGLKSGYNPYNSGSLGKQEWKKKKNLREFSKWIELRKKMTAKKEEEE